jgi:hypothetical protein
MNHVCVWKGCVPFVSRSSSFVRSIVFDYVIVIPAKKGKHVGRNQVIGLQGHGNVSLRRRMGRKGEKIRFSHDRC